ncbi:MAG: hypothetical protein CVT84_10975 [Alphaproteobacteria bacterium HGW-Alphaproteobacteria-6]|nr:MAG: hypothetical protein CVT84_10975 [Alphaproteobacteria bacterium HGW-Alphaproteobacteria-6]
MVVRGGFAGLSTAAGAAGQSCRNGMMTMRLAPCLAAILALSACAPPPPDDRLGGVGFESYAEFQRRREAELLARRSSPQTVLPPVAGTAIAGAAPAGTGLGGAPAGTGPGGVPAGTGLGGAGAIVSGPISAGPIGQASALPTAPQPAAPPPVVPGPPVYAGSGQVPPAAPLPEETPDNLGISDEQNFDAVAARETIESDKQRMAQNRAQYEQVQPRALPPRVTETGAGIVAYAISAPNRLGEAIYRRSGVTLGSSARACARFDTPEAAQEAFLKAGGPQRDRRNLDPDGDGFACSWDPTPFQKVRG